MASLFYTETPIQEIKTDVLERASVKLLIKREDLNHPFVSGNKWWKLKYNLEEAVRLKHDVLLTFGGAYSNHIFATAAAAHELGLKSIGIIRGERTLPLNHTLTFALEKGMRLHYVSREDYRHKAEDDFMENLRKRFGDFYSIPEGGTNALAVKGCEEFAKKILSEIEFDNLCLPVGTGGTMAGIVAGFGGEKEVIGFPVLKGGAFLEGKIMRLLKNDSIEAFKNWKINADYHFGGYGKKTKELRDFISTQWHNHHLPLDQVYGSKMMFGIYDVVKKGNFKKGSTILALHTGGLQGNNYF